MLKSLPVVPNSLTPHAVSDQAARVTAAPTPSTRPEAMMARAFLRRFCVGEAVGEVWGVVLMGGPFRWR
ncbi:hypothetical protein GCM10009570_05030 [Dietzia natronolimnaea]